MLARREILRIGAAFLGSRACDPMNYPSRLPALAPADDSIVYYRGRHRIRISKPRVAYEAPPGGRAWFTELCYFRGTNDVCLRFSSEPDDQTVSTGGLVVSHDRGQTWDASSFQEVSGSGDPLVYDDTTGTFIGGTFASLFYTRPGGNKRVIQMPRRVLSRGGAKGVTMTITPAAITISGFPFDIENVSADFPYPNVNWYGEILRLSATHWVSTILPIYASQSNVVWAGWIESFDAGFNWTWKSHVSTYQGGEGFSETSPIQLPNGDFLVVSRNGEVPMVQARSSDGGSTWTDPVHFTPWAKSPRINMLSNNQDFVITSGGIVLSALVPPGLVSVVDGSIPAPYAGYAPAVLGLYVHSDPLSLSWPVVDLAAHHNATMPASMAFDAINQTTGYTGKEELDPGHLLISCDQAGQAYFPGNPSANPNRIFVADVWIDRVS